MPRWPWLLLLPIAGARAAACSLLAATDGAQCEVDADCAARGFSGTVCADRVCVAGESPDAGDGGDAGDAGDPKWGCVGHVQWGDLDTSTKVLFRQRFLAALTEVPLADVELKVCKRLDVDCTAPETTGKTDVDGYINLEISKNFDGFFLATAVPDAGVVPSIIVPLPPQSTDMQADASISNAVSLHLITQVGFDALLAQIKASADPQLGHLFGLAVDCTQAPAAKISIHADTITPETIPYYTAASGLPAINIQETSHVGEAGFVNLPVGTETITATSSELVKQIGSYTVFIKAGHITYLPMPPSP